MENDQIIYEFEKFLSPRAQEVYKNKIHSSLLYREDREDEDNGPYVMLGVHLTYPFRFTWLAKHIDSNTVYKQAVVYIEKVITPFFNYLTKENLIEEGVCMRTTLVHTGKEKLMDNYTIYLIPYSRYSYEELNEKLGVNIFVPEGEVSDRAEWDKLFKDRGKEIRKCRIDEE